MNAVKSYLIVVPAYNEEEYLPQVLFDIRKSNPQADILVVNDGSSDDTSQIARETGVKVLDIPFNIGYGGAVQTGFRFAVEYGHDFVITIDGDGQHNPYHTNRLIDIMEREQADVVIGSRFLEGNYRIGIARRLGIWLFSKIAKLYTGVHITDPTSGFQLLNYKVFSYLSRTDNYPLDYPDVNIIMALHKMKFKLAEAPVKMTEKPNGKSMHNGFRPLYYILRMTLAIIMVLLRKED
jgi:glycosyltransferase involved in cell wall biosynthesis